MYPQYGQSNRKDGAPRRSNGKDGAPQQEGLTLGVGEAGKCAQVGQALAALDPPGPLAADRGAEAELERRVEVLVGVAEHAAEQPVDVRGGDSGQRQPPGQVHVAHRVQGEVDPVHAAVALEQEAVERLVVLVRLAAEERLHAQAVLADDQPDHGGQLVLALEFDQVGAGSRVLVRQAELGEGRLDGSRGRPGNSGHARTVSAASSMAPVYTSISRSAVAGQPNPDACASAPRDSSASRPGDATSPESTRAHTTGSCPSTRMPEKPSLTAVRSPPTAAATTGVPQA